MSKKIQANLFKQVYLWMFLGLLVSAITSFFTITTPLANIVFSNFIIFIGLIILELILVWTLSRQVFKMSKAKAQSMFLLYSAINGITLAIILLAYTLTSIVTTFLLTASMFGIMAFLGYTTKKDLSDLGSILLMGLIGIILAFIVNWFLKNSLLNFIITIIGIILFLALTAYDNNKLKKLVKKGLINKKNINHFAISGALSLYLDFINLFILLLRLLGKRK